MAYRKPREIHYELAPRTQHRPVSVYRIVFALIVGILILAAILVALYVVWYVYLRPHPPVVNYRRGEAIPETPVRTARPVMQHRKRLEVIVAYSDNNTDRAGDVAIYLNKTLGALIDKTIYTDFTVSKVRSFTTAVWALHHISEFLTGTPLDSVCGADDTLLTFHTLRSEVSSNILQIVGNNDRMTLQVPLHRTFRIGSTAVVVSEQFPPTGQQIWDMIRSNHFFCRLFVEELCVELCAVSLQPDHVPNITPAVVDYEILDVRIRDIEVYAQSSAIYRQNDNNKFSLARSKRGCIPMS
ncbi:hypothetical protein BIW11_09632 [Tropilaelaps mercedesae]|uniref:Uncharacterized protein n=1 Tax=Tropilaelaps mercedesae TaxID=418985 RepID=A0A1V9XJ84_9ACAR|nr:hypothetical protein BIW11_09632 [Tropilaelaps mercedesae]